eukprot:6027046-Pleurochrysis_carterae.AAC.1
MLSQLRSDHLERGQCAHKCVVRGARAKPHGTYFSPAMARRLGRIKDMQASAKSTRSERLV